MSKFERIGLWPMAIAQLLTSLRLLWHVWGLDGMHRRLPEWIGW